jgi:hypothetical protein
MAVGLAILGVLLTWAALTTPPDPDPGLDARQTGSTPSATPSSQLQPAANRRASDGDRSDSRDQIRGVVLPESAPVSVSIPRIRVRSRLVDLGLDQDGALEVPQDARLAGWFSRGAAPGALGPAVIAGHVTWNGSAAVFRRLGSVRRGDLVTVTRKDGKTAVFAVDRVAQFPKSQFPTREVYGAIDHAGLRLITCGGSYDRDRHRYLDNVVVFARLAEVRQSGG